MAEHIRPSDIEETSMRIIGEELEKLGIVPEEENLPLVKRVIHTTADFDYAENLLFTEHACERGREALAKGGKIISDTNMAKAGISKVGLEKLGGSADCYMADPKVAEEAKKEGCTRAVISMRKAAKEDPGCILAVGNAPTALFEIARLIKGGLRPALVIAVPVGFVNVVEAKEEIFALCKEKDIPCIMARGRKGGSTVAAAICNALIYSAADMQKPQMRGWN